MIPAGRSGRPRSQAAANRGSRIPVVPVPTAVRLVGVRVTRTQIVGTQIVGTQIVGTQIVGTQIVGTQIVEAEIVETELIAPPVTEAVGGEAELFFDLVFVSAAADRRDGQQGERDERAGYERRPRGSAFRPRSQECEQQDGDLHETDLLR
jgi:hypothetical protein